MVIPQFSGKDEKLVVPLTTVESSVNQRGILIQFGQHSEKKWLEGAGRKTWITDGGVAMIWEGYFKNNMMHGFGRRITVRNRLFGNDKYSYEIGNWVHGEFEGYGKRFYMNNTQEGLFEDKKIVKPKDHVEPEDRIEINKYLIGGTKRIDINEIVK